MEHLSKQSSHDRQGTRKGRYLSLLILGWIAFVLPPDCALRAQEVAADNMPPVVTVVYEIADASAYEMVELVCYPVEAKLNGGRHISSVSAAVRKGIVTIWVEFDPGTEMNEARQIVAQRLQGIPLPIRATDPRLLPSTSGEVLLIAISPTVATENADQDEDQIKNLRAVAERLLRSRLLAIPDVADVVVNGGYRRRYEVVADQDRLTKFDLTLAQLANAARQSKLQGVGGDDERLIIRAGDESGVIENLGATIVATVDEQPVRISDVAEVKVAWLNEADIVRGWASADLSARADPVHYRVLFAVQLSPGADLRAVNRQVNAVLESIEPDLPANSKVERRVDHRLDILASLAKERLQNRLPFGWEYLNQSADEIGDYWVLSKSDAVVAKLFGPDPNVLQSQAKEVLRSLRGAETTRKARYFPAKDLPEMVLDVDERTLERLGLKKSDLAEALAMNLGGQHLLQIQEDGAAIDIVLTTRSGQARSNEWHKLPIRTEDGSRIPLGELATIELRSVPELIYRENQVSVGFIICELQPNRRAEAMAKIKAALEPVQRTFQQLEAGYRVVLSGD